MAYQRTASTIGNPSYVINSSVLGVPLSSSSLNSAVSGGGTFLPLTEQSGSSVSPPLLFTLSYSLSNIFNRVNSFLNRRLIFNSSICNTTPSSTTAICGGLLLLSEMDEDEVLTKKKEKHLHYEYTNKAHGNDKSHDNDGNESRPLYIFSIDITQLSPIVKSVVLIGGLILFMCLYGYYQELVVYGWFNRQLSIFSTFLHFLGCAFFAQLQRNMSNPTSNANTSSSASHSQSDNKTSSASTSSSSSIVRKLSSSSYFTFHMGTASPQVAFGYYALLVFLKTICQGLSNLSMTQINYPAKVLFKSANPVITMIIGVCWFHKSYPLRDYLVVLLLIMGLYIFITGESFIPSSTGNAIIGSSNNNDPHSATAPSATMLGIVYVSISMFSGASIPMIQEHCMAKYHASVDDLLYFSFLGGTMLSLVFSIVNGEFHQGIQFLWSSSSPYTTFIFIAFCTFGFLGSNFSTGITSQYGALVNGICNTFRKAVTIALSFVLFPERNHLTLSKVYGIVVFFSGLMIRIFFKQHQQHIHHLQHHIHSIKENGVGRDRDDLRSLIGDSDEEEGLGVDKTLEGERMSSKKMHHTNRDISSKGLIMDCDSMSDVDDCEEKKERSSSQGNSDIRYAGSSTTCMDDDIGEMENNQDMENLDENETMHNIYYYSHQDTSSEAQHVQSTAPPRKPVSSVSPSKLKSIVLVKQESFEVSAQEERNTNSSSSNVIGKDVTNVGRKARSTVLGSGRKDVHIV